MLLTSTAVAQDGDGPYGSTTTTTGAPRTATMRLTVDSGPRGTEVGVFACGYAPGVTNGSVTFDGQVVASGLTADAEGCLTADGDVNPSSQSDAPLTIRVPDDARPGQRNVCGVMAGYNTPCEKFQVRNEQGQQTNSDAQVLGITLSKGVAGALGLGPSGSLPRTGLAIVALLGVAAGLVLAGRTLLEASRRRRRRAHQAAWQAGNHLGQPRQRTLK